MKLSTQRAFSVFEVSLAALVFLLIFYLTNSFFRSTIESPNFLIKNEEILKKMQNLSEITTSSNSVASRVEDYFQFTKSSLCSSNQTAILSCNKIQIQLPSEKTINWYIYTEK